MSTCKGCLCPKDGAGDWCVICYAKRHKPCPNCMREGVKGRWYPRRRGKPPKPIECGTCANERFVLIDPKSETIIG
jgi:hypothetical protein